MIYGDEAMAAEPIERSLILGSAYPRLYANSDITKPVDLERFIAVMRSIEGFWLSVVKLPRRLSQNDRTRNEDF